MKQLKKIGLIALAAVAILGCEKDKPITPEMALTPVYVESGTIQSDTLFVSNGAFDANNTAVGMIDSTDCATINGYADKEGWIYVFEGGRPPQRALNDSDYDRFKCLTEAAWQNDYVYNLNLCAEICQIASENKYFFREAGDYQRQTAVIYNTNIYRFKNRYVIEDYNNFGTFHEFLRPAQPSGDFFTLLGLSKEEYTATYNGTAFTAVLDYTALPLTRLGQTDKITFTSRTNPNVKIRLRHVFTRYDDATKRRFFEGQNRVRLEFQRDAQGNARNNAWIDFLSENIIPQYLEPTVTGYKCTNCDSNKGAKISASFKMPPPLCGGASN